MARNKLLDDQINGLCEEAQAEVKRLWALKDTMPMLNDATLPLLCLYAGAWAEARKLTLQLSDEEDEDLYDINLQRLEKTQKLVLSYAKLLKLDTKPAAGHKNKFFEILTK